MYCKQVRIIDHKRLRLAKGKMLMFANDTFLLAIPVLFSCKRTKIIYNFFLHS